MAQLNTIPVRTLRFVSPQDGPGYRALSTVHAVDSAGRRTGYEIAYNAALRHFQIAKGDAIEYVHESRVSSWIPLRVEQPAT